MRTKNAADRCRECLELIAHGPPLTPEQLAEYDRLRAREMARAEARRQPSPQGDLDGV